ncbi:MAG TPA: alpha/beta fold hydrolase [Phycisphaerae bacterium]|nr:alpha/beta fold hydrolase [Phycisphaerae bacterium]
MRIRIGLASLTLAALAIAGCAMQQGSSGNAGGKPNGETFVLVHGAWGGAWDWRNVERGLRADGHDVYRAQLTGQGDRVHLATQDTNLTTHITDVANLIEFENLHNVVLMGHSYGGMVITGVAEKVPERIKCLVYVDALLPNDGESADSILAATRNSPPRTPTNGFILPTWAVSPNPPHDVPMPAKAFTETISLKSAAARKVPAVYLLLVDPGKTAAEDTFYPCYQRAVARGWETWTYESDHNAQRSHVADLVKMLEKAPGAAKAAK